MHHKEWAENEERIMARNIALNVAKRQSSSNGKNKSEVAVLDVATGLIHDQTDYVQILC